MSMYKTIDAVKKVKKKVKKKGKYKRKLSDIKNTMTQNASATKQGTYTKPNQTGKGRG